MIIKRARAYGMCFGVRDAVAAAEAAALRGPATVLGQLVHNPVVLDRLRQQGIRVVEHPAREILQAEGRYLITAHGVSDTQRAVWQKSGAELQDTTCPLVRKAHDRLRAFVAMGLHPVVIGKVGHVEVRGLIGDYPGAVVIETEADIEALPRDRSLGVVAQTTQPIGRVRKWVQAIRRARPGQPLYFADTVCLPTKERQAALRELCREVEMIIVVGGRHSNNTRQLQQAACDWGVRAFAVERPEDLQPEWLRGVKIVGLTAGTSTPDTVIDAVEAAIGQLTRLEELPAAR